MATFGSIKTDTYGGVGYAQLTWELVTQDVARNVSTILVIYSFTRTATISTPNLSYELVVAGQGYVDKVNLSGEANTTQHIKSLYLEVPHPEPEGEAEIDLSIRQIIKLDSWSSNQSYELQAFGTGTLNAIARVSVPTLASSTFNFGDTLQINAPVKDAVFTNDLYVTIPAIGVQSQLIASNVTGSWLWHTPASYINQLPNASSTEVIITCQTKIASTGKAIAEKVVTAKGQVPSTYAPTIDTCTVTDPMGYAVVFARYIGGKSRVRVVAKATGKNGATISSYKAYIFSSPMPYTETLSDGSVQITSGIVNASYTIDGQADVRLVVTDSRGHSTERKITINVYSYVSPSISKFNAFRANASGVADDEGNYIAFDTKYSLNPIDKLNTKTHTIQYRVQGETEWLTLQSGELETYHFSGVIRSLTEVLDGDHPYEFRLSVTDYFSTVRATSSVSVAYTLMDFHKDGHAMAFGKVCEMEEGVEFDLPVIFHKAGKVLWQGAYWMQASGNDVNLSEPISKQMNGIYLVFSRYLNGASDMQFNTFFVHKKYVELFPGKTTQFLMSTDGIFGKIGSKVLKFTDTTIVGVDNNKATGTANGITYDNSAFVLRYVLGV